jgi:hypothetical protein
MAILQKKKTPPNNKIRKLAWIQIPQISGSKRNHESKNIATKFAGKSNHESKNIATKFAGKSKRRRVRISPGLDGSSGGGGDAEAEADDKR